MRTEITKVGNRRVMLCVTYSENSREYYGPFPSKAAAQAFVITVRKPSDLETFLSSDTYLALVHAA